MPRPPAYSYRWQPVDRARIDRLRKRLTERARGVEPTETDVLRAALAALEADLDREDAARKKTRKSAV